MDDEQLHQALDALPEADGAVVEEVLTAGYGRALELEAEHARHGGRRVSDRLAALRARLDEAYRHYRGSRQKDLDSRPGSGGGTDQELST